MSAPQARVVGRPDLPDFPWDALAPFATTARAHPGGVVDLSVGTPVDPTPEVVQRALASAADAPGYPAVVGTVAVREAIARWFARRRAVVGLEPGACIPTVGSKELVAWLPTLLGLGPGDAVVIPTVAYPTYDVGARLAGAVPVPLDPADLPPSGQVDGARIGLVWVNSPSNPTGEVTGVEALSAVVAWARRVGAVVASDECYCELAWDVEPGPAGVPSLLDPRVCGASHENLLVVQSLSKQSTLAGYRAGLLAGDPALVAAVVAVRKQAGMIVPAPVQAAMVAALDDDDHVALQRERYARRRAALLPALRGAGFEVPGSPAGLYLWARRGADAWDDVAELAGRGVLVAPGSFYGAASRAHVRVALTATDERVAAAVERLAP